MKKVISFAIVVLFLTSCRTSQNSFENFYKNHKAESEFSMKIPAFLANLFLKDEDLKEAKSLIKKAKSYRIMVFSENLQDLQSDFNHFVKKHPYKPLIMVKERKDKVGIYALENDNHISEIVLNVKDKESVVIMSVKTNLTYDELAEITKNID